MGGPICGVPAIIGIVMAGDIAPPLGRPIWEPDAMGEAPSIRGIPIGMEGDIDMPIGRPEEATGIPSN